MDKNKPEPSRSWKIGVGHIGKYFANNDAYIDEDISKDVSFRSTMEEEDEFYYKSAISVPLNSKHKASGEPFGVMLLIASEPSLFKEVHLDFFFMLKLLIEDDMHKIIKEASEHAKREP